MKRLYLCFAVAMAVGCAPHRHAPKLDIPQQYISSFEASGDTLSGDWWRVYNSPMLDELERLALENNKNLQVAVSRIEAARYELAVARSEFLPEVEAEIGADAEYQTHHGTEHQFQIQPAVSWNLSLFGALRHAVGEARAEILSSEWAYQGVRLSLTVDVATAYYTILQYDRSLKLAQRSLELRRQSASLIDSLSRYGMSTGLDLDQARSLVYIADSDTKQYSRALAQAKLSLATLLGKTPEFVMAMDWELGDAVDTLPEALPVGIPSDLLSRRPDVMESYYELQAAGAKVGIARSNRFPSIALTSDGGLVGSTVKELFTSGYWSWGAAAKVVQPLFMFGRLKRQEQIARAEYEDAVLEYEQSVLTALKEVESALVAISTYKSQREQYAEYVNANERIAELTMALYRNGMSNYLDVISTQQTWYNSQLQLVQLTSQQYINYANLVMALGDGWQTIE